MTERHPKYIHWFDEISVDDVPLVGGKNASLGEMYRVLTPQGIRVPNCFAISAQAPSDYPEMAEYLVNIGIDSISLNPDTVIKTTLHVLEVEKRLGRKPRAADG